MVQQLLLSSLDATVYQCTIALGSANFDVLRCDAIAAAFGGISLSRRTGGSSLSDILDSLSMDVRREVFKFLIDNTFSKVSLFDGAPSLFKTKTISEMRIVPFQAGSMLVRRCSAC